MFRVLLILAVLALTKSSSIPAVVPITKDTVLYKCALGFVIENMVYTDNLRNVLPEKYKYDENDCKPVLDKFRDNKYEYFKELYSDDQYYSNHVNCIVNKLKEFATADLYILKLVYKLDEDMTKIRRTKALLGALSPIDFKTDMAEELCLSEKMFSASFDSLSCQNEAVSSIENEIEAIGDKPEDEDISDEDIIDEDITDEELEVKFCILEYLKVTNFSGMETIKTKTCSKHLDMSKIDCSTILIEQRFSRRSILEQHFQMAPWKTTSKQSDCYHQVIKSSGYDDMMLLAETLAEISIETEEMIKQRQNFTKFMLDLYVKLTICLQ